MTPSYLVASPSHEGVGLANQLPDAFQNLPFDGIFGLAYKSMASDQVTPWMDNAVAQRLIQRNGESSFHPTLSHVWLSKAVKKSRRTVVRQLAAVLRSTYCPGF